MNKLISLDRAASLIAEDNIVTVSSSSGLGCPDALLKAIGERYSKTGSPKNLTLMHPIAAGDMYGIKGIEHLAQPGLIKQVLAGSYPSGPSTLPMPEIWRMIVDDEIAAYNIPSGILFDMHREAAAMRPGVITRIGMDTFVDPRREGCAMNDRASRQPVVKAINFDGQEWLYFPSIIPDVAIIRATSADEKGNLSYEHEGAILGGLEQALAAHNNHGIVIAQVKRIVKEGSLDTHDVRIPGNLVDYVVIDEEQQQTTKMFYDPAISGEIKKPLDTFDVCAWGAEKIIARRAAFELKSGMAANLGFGICANVPRVLLEENLHGEVTWVIEQGAVGGLPLLDFAFGCAANADAIMSSPNQFTYFQGGGFDVTLLSFMQIDKDGNVNVSKLGKRPYLTAGCGGFVDITSNAQNIVFCGYFTAGSKMLADDGKMIVEKEGKVKKLVEEVEHVTFSGRKAMERGHRVIYVTERCVMKLTKDGLMVTEIAPGIDLQEDILNQSEIPLLVSSNLKKMAPEIFREQPMNIEFERK